MRLVDFLIYLLRAHADTLQRLAALLGEENLVALLETAPENDFFSRPLSAEEASFFLPPQPSAARPPLFSGTREIKLPPPSPYQELEGTVREIGLPAILEFYLWAYPTYRRFIESGLDLDRLVSTSEAGNALIESAVTEARLWTRNLPISPSLAARTDAVVHTPWIRFRTEVLKHLGKRPMRALLP